MPEYLREPPKRRRLLTTVTLLVLAGCFTGVVLWVLGQFELGTPLGNYMRTGHFGAEVAAAPALEKGESEPGKSAPSSLENTTSGTHQPTKEQPKTPKTTTVAAADHPPAGPASANPAHAAPPSQPAVKPGPVLAGPAHVATAPPTAIAKIDTKLPPPANPPATPDSKLPATPATEPGKTAPETPKPPERIGHLVSADDQVLLAYNTQAGYWERLATRDPLVSQQRLLAPPTYRDEISIGAGVTVELLGGTQVQLLPGTEKEPVGLDIAFGRLALVPSQDATKLRLTVGGHSGLLTLTDNETFAALEVTRSSSPGVNPESDAPHAAADLYVTHGVIRWQEKGMAEPVRIIAPARLTLDEQSPHDLQTLGSKDLPKWIVLESLGALEQRASARHRPIASGRPLRRPGIDGIGLPSPEGSRLAGPAIAGLYRPVRTPGCRLEQYRLQGRLAEIRRAASPGHCPRAGNRRRHSPGHGEAIRRGLAAVVPHVVGLYQQTIAKRRRRQAGGLAGTPDAGLPRVGLLEFEGDHRLGAVLQAGGDGRQESASSSCSGRSVARRATSALRVPSPSCRPARTLHPRRPRRRCCRRRARKPRACEGGVFSAPKGRQSIARGVSPWCEGNMIAESPEGATVIGKSAILSPLRGSCVRYR